MITRLLVICVRITRLLVISVRLLVFSTRTRILSDIGEDTRIY